MLRNKGKRRLRVLTAGGELALSRRYFWARGEGGEFPADAVMAPTVTQGEKGAGLGGCPATDKRRKAHAVRRQQRSAAGVGNAKDLPPARPGSGEKYKRSGIRRLPRDEKIGIFYDQDKARRHAFATEGKSDSFAPLLKTFGTQVGFDKASRQVSLTDGAKWIITQLCLAFTTLSAMLLDFYHLSQHVHATAKCCLGETAAATQWAQTQLAEMKEQGIAGVSSMLAAIDTLSKRFRSPAKLKSLRLLRD